MRCTKTLCNCDADPCSEALEGFLSAPATQTEFACNSTGYCQLAQKELAFIINAQCEIGACVDRNISVSAFAG